jgi:hypothetical protein
LQKTEGEEGELIRDIEQITKQINAFLTFTWNYQLLILPLHIEIIKIYLLPSSKT